MTIIQAQSGFYAAPVFIHSSLDWTVCWGGDVGAVLSHAFTFYEDDDDYGIYGESVYPHLYKIADERMDAFVDKCTEQAVRFCYSSRNRRPVIAWKIDDDGVAVPITARSPQGSCLTAVLFDDPRDEDASPKVQTLNWSGSSKVSAEQFSASDSNIKDALSEAIWQISRDLLSHQRRYPDNIKDLAAEAEKQAAAEAEHEDA